ncbi:hypothetical protein MJO10_29330, partial [Salmonella enterica subsp. enterica serovar Anatum]|nr:hypothetical protein [Salmonella enterica subsp. enterica serovar Anatum]
DEGLDGYRDYLIKYSDRELVQFFENAQLKRQYGEDTETVKREWTSKHQQYRSLSSSFSWLFCKVYDKPDIATIHPIPMYESKTP